MTQFRGSATRIPHSGQPPWPQLNSCPVHPRHPMQHTIPAGHLPASDWGRWTWIVHIGEPKRQWSSRPGVWTTADGAPRTGRRVLTSRADQPLGRVFCSPRPRCGNGSLARSCEAPLASGAAMYFRSVAIPPGSSSGTDEQHGDPVGPAFPVQLAEEGQEFGKAVPSMLGWDPLGQQHDRGEGLTRGHLHVPGPLADIPRLELAQRAWVWPRPTQEVAEARRRHPYLTCRLPQRAPLPSRVRRRTDLMQNIIGRGASDHPPPAVLRPNSDGIIRRRCVDHVAG